MKKVSRGTLQMEKPEITIGLDLGDRFSHYCMLNEDGEAIETGRIQTTAEGWFLFAPRHISEFFRRLFSPRGKIPALE
jgi:hypothetical protein